MHNSLINKPININGQNRAIPIANNISSLNSSIQRINPTAGYPNPRVNPRISGSLSSSQLNIPKYVLVAAAQQFLEH